MKKTVFSAVIVALWAMWQVPPAWGQAGTSVIRGTVTDPQGLLIAGANVTITNPSTGYARSQVTTAAGTFSFELIPPGDYNLEVEAQGFRKKLLSKVSALVGAPTDVSVPMELGPIAQMVTVEATPAGVSLNTQDATLGNAFVSQQILQLPMEARNVQALLTLQPGVTPDGYVSGARSDQSNITLDGADINDAESNSLGEPVLRLNSEAIEEFRVTTVNPNANQGRSSAAQITLVTKSGTNKFHGSLFEYHRNTIFTANDFFNNRIGLPRPKLLRNTFGGTLGGPIKRDKLFFFYSYEGRRDASQGIGLQTVPLPGLGQGTLNVEVQNCTPVGSTNCTPSQLINVSTANLNNMFPAVGMNPASIAALGNAASKYPYNDFTTGDSQPNKLLNTAGFRFNVGTPLHLNSHVARMDWNISNQQSLFVRGQMIDDVSSSAPHFPDTPRPSLWSHPWGMVVSHTWNFGGKWVNNFRYGLTRQANTSQGDSSANAIYFRSVFSPLDFSRVNARTTPVHNIVNDTSRVSGSHTLNFGTNITFVRNNHLGYGNAFDTAITNYYFYQGAGASVISQMEDYLPNLGYNTLVSRESALEAVTALIGRYTQYSARFTFDHSGKLVPSGTASRRTFATEEYDGYIQDAWRARRNLTLTYGLRYSLGHPVYETGGFGVTTTPSTSEFFRRRLQGAMAGTPYIDPLVLNLAGGNGTGPLYNWDKNNFQPRAAVAWSPKFQNPFLKGIFGEGGKSVLRGGFAMTNDYYGQALAVAFDQNNRLGFTSSQTISANTFNVTNRPGPLFTGFGQDVRSLPQIVLPGDLSFPREQPSDGRRRIESGLDTDLTAPVEYMWNATFERELRAGTVFQLNYTGRLGRKLLANRDVMALNNLRDPKSGMDWYTAATILEKLRQTGAAPGASIQPIAYFENLYPANFATLLNDYSGYGMPDTLTPTQAVYWQAYYGWGNDWTDEQDETEGATGIPYYFNPQYGALAAWGTIANSNYHGLSLSLRQRYHGLLWDFNYTFSHSLDDASGLQTAGTYGSGFILNPIRQRDNYTNSDFDLRHVINISGVFQLPFGRSRRFGSGVGRGLDALIGGWQLSGIFRWNTGLPLSPPYDDGHWATNWEIESDTTQVDNVRPCVTRGIGQVAPKLFGCNTTQAFQSFRNAYPGETGQRNTFRLPGYIAQDAGLSKSFTMPWNERHKLQIRWEVFNVGNNQHFGALDFSSTGWGLPQDPKLNNLTPPSNFSNFVGIQGSPRVMQVGARYEF